MRWSLDSAEPLQPLEVILRSHQIQLPGVVRAVGLMVVVGPAVAAVVVAELTALGRVDRVQRVRDTTVAVPPMDQRTTPQNLTTAQAAAVQVPPELFKAGLKDILFWETYMALAVVAGRITEHREELMLELALEELRWPVETGQMAMVVVAAADQTAEALAERVAAAWSLSSTNTNERY